MVMKRLIEFVFSKLKKAVKPKGTKQHYLKNGVVWVLEVEPTHSHIGR